MPAPLQKKHWAYGRADKTETVLSPISETGIQYPSIITFLPFHAIDSLEKVGFPR